MRKAFILFLFIISLSLHVQKVMAQTNTLNKVLLEKQDFAEKRYDRRKPEFLFKSSKNVLVKYNPVTLTFGSLLFMYQKGISPQLSANCPYVINCSNFSKQCIQHYGMVKGIALTADRLTRCTQFTLIDLRPSQFTKERRIIDPVEQYTFKHAH
jgi:putative component of membrane protein insertase Oxa1/YidC/SpoIIIJ protein YidD